MGASYDYGVAVVCVWDDGDFGVCESYECSDESGVGSVGCAYGRSGVCEYCVACACDDAVNSV